jgi:hypothetical protein
MPAFIGVGSFKGYWNASTNSGSAPELAPPLQPLLETGGYDSRTGLTPAVGDYWQVNTAGTNSGTAIDGATTWTINDWMVYTESSAWERLSTTDTVAAVMVGDASFQGLKDALLASGSAAAVAASHPGGKEVTFVASNDDGKYFDGDPRLTYDTNAGTLYVTGNIFLTGTLEASIFHTTTVSSSIIYQSGSTKFGNTDDDMHQFTGSVYGNLGITSSLGMSASYFFGDGSHLTGLAVAGSTLGNPVYVSAAQYRVPHWGAADGDGDFGLTGSANLSFFTTTNDLQVTGTVRATNMYVGTAGSIYTEGNTNTQVYFGNDLLYLLPSTTNGINLIGTAGSEITTFNIYGNNVDFQVKTDNSDRALWVDGASDNVGIRCAPSGTIQALTVSGSTLFGSASANSHEFIGSIYAEQDIVHLNDADTKITFTNDQIDFAAGGVTLLTLDEDGQNLVTVGDGTDVDFKVRALGDDFAIFVQGSSDTVGIGTSNPLQKLSVSGSTVFGTAGGTDSHWFTGSVFVTDDLHVEDKIYGMDDVDTYLDLSTNDQLALRAGGVTMVHLVESTEDYLQLGAAGSGTDAVDIRMGGGGYDNTLWVDGGSHNVGIRCAPSGTIQALTVSGSTLFGSASANTHEFIGSVSVTQNISFGGNLHNASDDDTYLDFTDDRVRIYAGNIGFADFDESGGQNATTLNAGGTDVDFVVKSNGGGMGGTEAQTHTIFVEGSTARVGIAESSPGAQLDVSGSTIFGRHDGDTVSYHQVSGTLELTGNIGVNTPATTYSLALPNTDSLVGRGMAYAWSTYSSARYKDNVLTMADPIETAKKLRGVEFTWKETGNKDFGFIAEEVGKVLPQLVSYESDGKSAVGMDYSKITSLLVECVKTQQDQLETQEKRIKYLERKFET